MTDPMTLPHIIAMQKAKRVLDQLLSPDMAVPAGDIYAQAREAEALLRAILSRAGEGEPAQKWCECCRERTDHSELNCPKTSAEAWLPFTTKYRRTGYGHLDFDVFLNGAEVASVSRRRVNDEVYWYTMGGHHRNTYNEEGSARSVVGVMAEIKEHFTRTPP